MHYFFVKMNLKVYREIVYDCRACPKRIPQYRDYQLADHLYISPRIISIKAHHTSVKHPRLSVVLSHYDNVNVKWSHYEFSVVLMCIPKVKIVKNLSLFLHQCTFTMHRPRVHSKSQWRRQHERQRPTPPGQFITLQVLIVLKEILWDMLTST